ncbi:MAG: hypothetical protein AAFP19_13300, partial [Bacteroidota bacterium]
MSQTFNRYFSKIKRWTFAFGLLTLLSGVVLAQGWEQTYGSLANETARDLSPTADGGWLLLGHSNSFGAGDRDIYLVKTDVNGQEDWSTNLPITQSDELAAAFEASGNGNYLIAGTQLVANQSYLYLLEVDAMGQSLWSVRSEEDSLQCRALSILPDGGAALVGVQQSYVDDGNGNLIFEGDFYIWRTDDQGNTLWTQSYGGPAYDEAYDCHAKDDGSLLVLGNTQSFGAGGFDIWLLQLDGNGELMWDKTYGGPFADLAYALEPTADGGYLITGRKNELTGTEEDIYLLKIDAEGEEQWSQTIPIPACQSA